MQYVLYVYRHTITIFILFIAMKFLSWKKLIYSTCPGIQWQNSHSEWKLITVLGQNCLRSILGILILGLKDWRIINRNFVWSRRFSFQLYYLRIINSLSGKAGKYWEFYIQILHYGTLDHPLMKFSQFPWKTTTA